MASEPLSSSRITETLDALAAVEDLLGALARATGSDEATDVAGRVHELRRKLTTQAELARLLDDPEIRGRVKRFREIAAAGSLGPSFDPADHLG